MKNNIDKLGNKQRLLIYAIKSINYCYSLGLNKDKCDKIEGR